MKHLLVLLAILTLHSAVYAQTGLAATYRSSWNIRFRYQNKLRRKFRNY